MATRKKNLLVGGPKKSTAVPGSSVPSSSLSTGSLGAGSSKKTKQKKIDSFFDSDDVPFSEPPSKKQKSSNSSPVTRTSPRKLSASQLVSETVNLSPQRTSPRKKQKERPTTPVPESQPKDSRRSIAISQISDVLNDSIPEEDDGTMETDPETRTGSKRRSSKILDEAMNQVKKMKIEAQFNETDAINLKYTVSIRTSQPPGKQFRKQKAVFGDSTQRISSQQMIIYDNKNP